MGFFANLFDFSFSEFLTKKIIKLLYVLVMIIIGLGCLVFMFFEFNIFKLILTPLIFFISIVFLRVYLEMIMLFFKIEENTRQIRNSENL